MRRPEVQLEVPPRPFTVRRRSNYRPERAALVMAMVGLGYPGPVIARRLGCSTQNVWRIFHQETALAQHECERKPTCPH